MTDERYLVDWQNRSREALNASAFGVGHLGLDGNWLRANERLCGMLGHTPAEFESIKFDQMVDDDDALLVCEKLEQLIRGDFEHFEIEMRLKHANGNWIHANITSSLQRAADESPLYFIVLVASVPEREELNRQLKKAQAAAEEGSRLKSEFVANVSHEIRTPMNAILGMTELALEEDLTAELRDYITTAHESAKSLLSLVNDLLDFSRMESGKVEMESTVFDLWETIDETAKALSLSASEKGLELLTDVSKTVPRYAQGDPLRLRQVITNLVSNAIKFTDRGEVVITASLQKETPEESVVRFSVVDTGIGISASDKQRIFKPFTQADASTTRLFGGSGLGLAICSELILQLGGELGLESEPGKGSEFFFTARLGKVEPPTELIERRQLRLQQLSDQRVLIVDDNTTNRDILEKLLRQMSIQVESVDNGVTAMRRIRLASEAKQPYDIVLVDALMPGKDGFSVVEDINADDQLVSTTVLMLSSADRSTFAERTNDLKIDGFLDKPVTRRELLEVMSVVSFGADQTNGEQADISILPQSLNVLVVEDTPANQKVVSAILRKRGHNVSLANNGRDAIERVSAEPFDVVLMDVQMPTVDGYQATVAIREMENPTFANLPIIAMTAHAMKGDADRCFAAGMNDYISKPIQSKLLVQLVEKWGDTEVANASDDGTTDQTDVLQSDKPAGSQLIDFEMALSRLDGNRRLLADLINFFREDVPQLLSELVAGLRGQNAAAVRRAAHSIKGLAASFEAHPVRQSAGQIEKLASQNMLDKIPPELTKLQELISEMETEFADFER